MKRFKKGDIVRHIHDTDKRWQYEVVGIQGEVLVLSIHKCPPHSDMLGEIWTTHSKYIFLLTEHGHNHPHTKLFK